jgi:tetratricopeptide (TPR) repeat protein
MRGTSALRAVALSIVIAFGTQLAARAQAPVEQKAADSADAAQAEEIARQHFQLGRAQYENGAFRDAAASFERAYELSKRDVLWYNLYLAYRDAGDSVKAATALRNYLTRVEEVENRAQLEARLESLDRIVAEAQERAQREQARAASEVATSEQPETQPGQPEATRAAPEAPREAAGPSIVPYVVMGAGGAMVIAGVVTGVMASAKHSELEEQCRDRRCDPSLQGLADEGQTLALTADILLFGGIAVAATGGVLWWLDRAESSSEPERPVDATVTCGLRACGARVRLTF